MHLIHLRLRDFRNYARLDVDFAPGFHLLLGSNGQGKTNILEAIYLLATLRSFRGVGSAQMVRHGQTGYFVGANIVGQGGLRQSFRQSFGERTEIKLYWSARERRLSLDGQPVRKLTDYWGTLRAVVFCTEDLQLVKGVSRARRRFMDLLLAQQHPRYLPLLQRYAQALRARNALLKRPIVDELALEGFTSELVSVGREITHMRGELAPVLAPLVRAAYDRIANTSKTLRETLSQTIPPGKVGDKVSHTRAGGNPTGGEAETLRLEYRPSVKTDFAVQLRQSWQRERSYGATLVGPHRDELDLLLNDRSAAQYASEGQKRTLAIALKMAQAEYLLDLHGTAPLLLIDDVMGELDVSRRAALLPLLERARKAGGQIFMTATEQNWPEEIGQDVQKWRVEGGAVRRET